MSICDEHGTADYCSHCGDGYPRMTYAAGYMAAAGQCESCDAAAEPKSASTLRAHVRRLEDELEESRYAHVSCAETATALEQQLAAAQAEARQVLSEALEWRERAERLEAEARELRFRNEELEAVLRAETLRLKESRASIGAIHYHANWSDADAATLRAIADECVRAMPELAALSQPAEQPAAQEALPLMARETAARMIGPTLAECVTKATEGGIQYLIADTDEHGLPVIPRTADMPEVATHKITWLDDGKVDFTDCAPMALEANRSGGMSERIEDYNEHGQEGRE